MRNDERAREQALDPSRSFIVQAPAGSGKTELLTQRYLRLLARVEAPEQILALTFTRKAAAEMRTRILHAVESAAAPPPLSEHKRTTWELARAVRAADERYDWHLTEHPARLRIQTIDALNASLSRRLPVLSGTGAALEPTDDPRPLYELAGRRLIERLGEASSVAAQLEVLIVHLGNRVDRIIDLLCDLLAKRDQWLHPVMRARSTADLRSVLEGTLKRLVERHLQLLCETLGPPRLDEIFTLLKFSADNLLENPALAAARRAPLERVREHACLAPDSETLAVWRCVATLLFKQDGDLYLSVDARHGFPKTNREMKSRMLSLLQSLSSDEQACERLADLRALPDPNYTDEQWRTLVALLELLPAVVAELQIVFQSRGEADYVEVALRALQALGSAEEPTDLALAFDHRVKHILVDEFQDTSFAQLDLLERLTAGWVDGDERTLFCVGDPMQSIYRFRQAEVGLFIELQQHGLCGLRLEPLRLEKNFRSAPEIVDWVNRVFPNVLAQRSDAGQGAVQYSASLATLESLGQVCVHAFVNGDADTEAHRVVSIVKDALARDTEGRVAVLVSARTHVGAIARALTEARIDFQAIEIEQLRERPVVQDLMALTRALVHLADRTAWLSILRAPWCGLTLPDLHIVAARSDRTIEAGMEAALASTGMSDEGRARLSKMLSIMQTALAERGRWTLRTWVERTWNALAGPASLARDEDLDDADAFFARLEDLEIAGDLQDAARLEEQLTRLFATARTAQHVRVELMTIHAAKGLEFETVIMPGLHKQVRAEDRELLRWTRVASAQGGFVLAPIKAEASDSDPIYRWIELLERQRMLRERARLLYVGVTRARRELHLLGNAQARERDGETSLSEPPRGSMLRMLWSAVASEFENAVPVGTGSSPAGGRLPQRLRRLPMQWVAPPPPEPVKARALEVIEIEEPEPPFDWVTLTSRHIGTLVHREIERMCRKKSVDRTIPREPMLARIRIELEELGVPTNRSHAASERVLAALTGALEDPRGRWMLGLEGGLSESESELALSSVIEGQIVEGIIDRTFVDASGVRWIVDFKTSVHEGGGLEAFLAQEVERYRPQLTRYAALMRAFKPRERVKAALYFPLLKAWREVEV